MYHPKRGDSVYKNSDFQREIVILCRVPTTAKEAYNKLVCLSELEEIYCQRFHPDVDFLFSPDFPHYSRRRGRLVRMYWAFKRKEVRTQKDREEA